MITRTHRYKTMTPELRPQDPNMDGSGLTFKTLEHGGEEPDMMPQAIKLTDADGRWCIYVPTTEDSKVVQSHGYSHNEDPKPTLAVVK